MTSEEKREGLKMTAEETREEREGLRMTTKEKREEEREGSRMLRAEAESW